MNKMYFDSSLKDFLISFCDKKYFVSVRIDNIEKLVVFNNKGVKKDGNMYKFINNFVNKLSINCIR